MVPSIEEGAVVAACLLARRPDVAISFEADRAMRKAAAMPPQGADRPAPSVQGDAGATVVDAVRPGGGATVFGTTASI